MELLSAYASHWMSVVQKDLIKAVCSVNQRKRRWLEHVLRHDVLMRDILEGRMTGKRTRGRKRLQLMSNICEGYETAKKRAEDRCL